MNDNNYENLIKESIDEQLEFIEFKESSKCNILDVIEKNNKSLISKILNFEIKIPIKKAVFIGCLSIFILFGVSFANFKVTTQNIEDSTIKYIEIDK